jgi:deazaflavin-dependent oxidoreductase (nitroreductase family)
MRVIGKKDASMAKQYSLTPKLRFFNKLIKVLVRTGLAPKNIWLLTVRGRKTGKRYSTPITLIEQGGREWLVAPYGEVGWVRNARSSGQVELSRGGRSEKLRISQVSPDESGPVLKSYVRKIGVVCGSTPFSTQNIHLSSILVS